MAWILANGAWDDGGTWDDGSNWFDGIATGGTVSTVTVGGVLYRVHTFLASDTFVLHLPATVEYLIVGGGGPGGFRHAGGGGAGGVRSGNASLSAGSYSVVVGAGGIASLVEATRGPNGGDSSFNGVTSLGGGAGGNNGQAGAAGASGGGGSNKGAGGAGTAGQGNNGGSTPTASNYAVGGGGGGAGAVGGTATTTVSGVGGAGVSSSITGTAVVYGGGGGGGGDGQRGLGGNGGGGNGSLNATVAASGTNGLGGGGGGGGAAGASSGTGGNGGSGVVILRYPVLSLVPVDLATGAPTVGTPTFTAGLLEPIGVTTGEPTVGSPTLGFTTPLTPVGIATGAPVVGRPIFKTYDFIDLGVDWGRNVEEELEFKTEIIVNRDGTEQRIAQRVNPRYSFRWRARGRAGLLRALERLFGRGQARDFQFAHPRAAVRAERGQPDRFFGRLTDALPVSAPTDSVVESADFAVMALPGMSFTAETFPAAGLTYRSMEVMPLSPNWARPVRAIFEQTVELFDFQRGVIGHFAPEAFTKRRVEVEYLIRSQAQEEALLGLFYRCKGKQKEFWFPDPLATLDPVMPVPNGQTYLTIPGNEAYLAFRNEKTYRNIALRLTTGTIYRQVSNVTLVGGDTRIALTSALPAISASTLIAATWLLRARFDLDSLTLAWITDMHASARVVIRSLEDFA